MVQAFCQRKIPPHEKYVLKPPHGDTMCPPNTYWLLLNTIYGLKRSPCHFFNLALKFFSQCQLVQFSQAPCLFTGHPIPGKPKLLLGLCVDDFIYFSQDREVEISFEQNLSSLTNVNFLGPVTYFLGIKFLWDTSVPKILTVHLSQEAFADHLVELAGLSESSTSINSTPYRSGNPVDAIPLDKLNNLSTTEQKKIQTEYRSYVGSLLWISQGTRPDLAVITCILAKHQTHPIPSHIAAAKYAIKYLKSTKTLGITFSNRLQPEI